MWYWSGENLSSRNILLTRANNTGRPPVTVLIIITLTEDGATQKKNYSPNFWIVALPRRRTVAQLFELCCVFDRESFLITKRNIIITCIKWRKELQHSIHRLAHIQHSTCKAWRLSPLFQSNIFWRTSFQYRR